MAKKSIGKNAIFNVSYKMLNILFPMVTSVYLARILGAVYMGKVAYAQNIMSYFLVVASLGIPTYGTREIAKRTEDFQSRNKIFTELFLLNLISSVSCSIIYTSVIMFSKSFYLDLTLYLCVGLTLYMNIFNIDWFFSGCEEYVYISIRSAVIKVLSLLAVFLFVKNEEDYLIYALINSVAATGNYILNVINLRHRVKFNFANLKLARHLKPMLILLVTVFATDLYNQVDITMLGAWCTDEVVGYYSYGIKTIRILVSVVSAIGATIMPRMCLLYVQNEKFSFQKLFEDTLHGIVILSLPASIGIILLRESIVKILFGTDFMPTANILAVLAPIVPVIGISYLIGSVILTATNNESALMLATMAGAVSNIIMNTMFIQIMGMQGAAIASVVSEVIVMLVHYNFSKKYIEIKSIMKDAKAILFALMGMVTFIIMIRSFCSSNPILFLVVVIIAVIIYFIILYLLKDLMVCKCIDYVKKIGRYWV